jgi:hypothetical protein
VGEKLGSTETLGLELGILELEGTSDGDKLGTREVDGKPVGLDVGLTDIEGSVLIDG